MNFARLLTLLVFVVGICNAKDITLKPIRLAAMPALSPDGKTLAFSWNEDIWTVSTDGGVAKKFTYNPAYDYRAAFSPDGKHLAFGSTRNGRWNIFVAPTVGGEARQISFHSDGEQLLQWTADGKSVLYQAYRDQSGLFGRRLFIKPIDGMTSEKLLFDASAMDGTLSPDGKSVLFTRGVSNPYRKGYVGTKVNRIWLYDREAKVYKKLVSENYDNRHPMWNGDGSGFYYTSSKDGVLNLWEYTLANGKRRQLTNYEEESVMYPTISRDGSTIVFRLLFDLYRFRPAIDVKPKKIDISASAEIFPTDRQLKTFKSATAITYAHDNLEIAVVAGGDLWVMDTVMREPVRVVKSPDQVQDSIFSKDHSVLYYILSDGTTSNIWQATRADAKKAWWENRKFNLKQVTKFDDTVSMMHMSKDGKKMMYIRGAGDLWIANSDFSKPRKIVSSWSTPYYAWSADGAWLAFSIEDNHFNRDIWIMPVDGSRKPFNISRNPQWDGSPAWSPDGKILAWSGKNMDKTYDVYYVYLHKETSRESSRDRKLDKARKLMKMRKSKKPVIRKPTTKKPTTNPTKKPAPAKPTAKPTTKPTVKKEMTEGLASSQPPTPALDQTVRRITLPPGTRIVRRAPTKKVVRKLKPMTIDFDDILQRVRRIPTKGINEQSLMWAPDSKRLVFRNTSGAKGTYQMTFPDGLKPTLLSKSTATWFKFDSRGTSLYGMDKGLPVVLRGTKVMAVSFTCMMEISRKNENRLLFNKIWATMRDRFYRKDMNGCDWEAVHKKYLPMAMEVPDKTGFQRVVNLMLGELNASHTGFAPTKTRNPTTNSWSAVTGHLGLKFDLDYLGPGLKIKTIIPGGPAFRDRERVKIGEIILEINGQTVDINVDLHRILNSPGNKPVELLVKDAKGKKRTVTIVSTTYGVIRQLLFKQHLRNLEKIVKQKSNNRLAYIRVTAMDWNNFLKFQKEIFARGFDKDGLIIDVRDNGGGFTADHLLTVLTQPKHAVTVPRGGKQGYPLDRSVYTYWHKPIVVLCNQNSFSNAEIFCHAIKTLKRGKLVGVQTAGGVISAGSANIDGKGTLRLPFRGWYLLNGEDMELNGAKPDFEVWPQPGDRAKGRDRQLEKAVEVLLKETE